MHRYSNVQIDTQQLPPLEDLSLIPLEKNYLKVRLLVWIMWTSIFTLVFFGVYSFTSILENEWIFRTVAGSIFLIILLIFIFSFYGYNFMFYALRERDIMFTKGLLIRTITVIPFNRIQHIEVSHGPVDRWFQLATLKIFTAGGQSSDLNIPGLSRIKAHQLRDYITQKAALNEEE